MIEKDRALNATLNASLLDSSVINKGSVRNGESGVSEEVYDNQGVNKQQIELKRKKYRRVICCTTVAFLIFLLVAVAMPFVIQGFIKKVAADQAVLSKDNYNVWGTIPGQTQTQFVREFTFFNFSNWEDVLLRGEKPSFSQIHGFKYIELQEALNPVFLDDGDEVKFDYWLHFNKKSDSRDTDELINVINPGPLGFWYNIKTAKPSLLFIQGIGILFVTLEDVIENVVGALGINMIMLPDFNTAWNSLYAPADIDKATAWFLWSDYNYGMSDISRLTRWIDAARKGFTSPEAQSLANYFGLTSSQLYSLIQSFDRYYNTISQLSYQNHYCQDGRPCTTFDLATRQIGFAEITNSPPPVKGLDPMDTLCILNTTCTNRIPELTTYYQKVFRKQHPDQQFANITFREETVAGWFKHSPYPNGNKAENCLLHAGNLDALFDNGTLFDQNNDEKALDNIRRRFKLDSREHAIVFWNWIKFYKDNFILQSQRGGTVEHIGIGLYGSRFFNREFIKAQDVIHVMLLQHKLLAMLEQTNCVRLFSQTFDGLTDDQLDTLCSYYDIRSKNSLKEMVYICHNKYNLEWQKLQSFGLNELQLHQMCDSQQPEGFGFYFDKAQRYLNDWYNCDVTPSPYCSSYELAIKQWANSEVTLKPIPELPYAPASTLRAWFPEEFRPFEYYHFTTKYPNRVLPKYTTEEGYKLINWDNFMNLYYMQNILINQKSEQKHLVDYLRYVMIYVTFDGFVKPRSPQDLLFGYNDSMITHLKEELDPIIGGDPSLPNLIHFNDLNVSREDAYQYPISLYTGKNNKSRLSFYKTINGVNWTNINASKWSGNQTIDYLKNPWDELDYFVGTDGKQSAPNQFQVNKVTIFIPNLLRYGTGSFHGDTYEKFGVTLHKGEISSDLYDSMSESEANRKYYQLFHAAMNLTSLYQFPVFATKNHFLDASKNWTTFIEIWDQNHTFKYEPSKWDDSAIDYEPYSGATFSAVIYLQTNYFYQPDFLFQYNQSCMMPIFAINRGGNLSEAGAKKLFGPLMMGLTAKKISVWVGAALASVFFVVTTVLVVGYRKIGKQSKDSTLSVSLQPHRGPNNRLSESQQLSNSADRQEEEEPQSRDHAESYVPPPVAVQP